MFVYFKNIILHVEIQKYKISDKDSNLYWWNLSSSERKSKTFLIWFVYLQYTVSSLVFGQGISQHRDTLAFVTFQKKDK